MSSRQRRLPEDSVLVSISQVQEMLRADATPPPTPARPQRPVPMPVPEEVIGGVPSMAEVEASRQQRWREEAPVARQALARRPGRPYLVGTIAGLAVLLALGGGVWLGVRWGRGPGAAAVAADAQFVTAQTMRLAAASTRADAAERAMAEARAEAQQLRADQARAEATAAQAAAAAQAAPPVEAPARPAAKRGSARKSAARTAPAPKGQPARPRRPMDNTDKHLSSLIESL